MTIRAFLKDTMICAGQLIKVGIKICLGNKESRAKTIRKEPTISLTAMGYSKQGDLFELEVSSTPQSKCDLGG